MSMPKDTMPLTTEMPLLEKTQETKGILAQREFRRSLLDRISAAPSSHSQFQYQKLLYSRDS